MEELKNRAYRYFSQRKFSFKTIGISIARCYFFIPPSFITYLAIPFTFWSSCDSVSSVQIDYKGSWCSSLQLTLAVNKNQEYQDTPVAFIMAYRQLRPFCRRRSFLRALWPCCAAHIIGQCQSSGSRCKYRILSYDRRVGCLRLKNE